MGAVGEDEVDGSGGVGFSGDVSEVGRDSKFGLNWAGERRGGGLKDECAALS